MKTAYLSALGAMGRRHLKGLIRSGFAVAATDPNPAVVEVARAELQSAGLDPNALSMIEVPTGRYDVAIFAETAPSRLFNYRRFLACAAADRLFLEKPLSADPAEFAEFHATAEAHDVAERTQVNLIRRLWPHVTALADLCADEREFAVTVTGGAIGMGCMGIHYLDTFLKLSREELPEVIWAERSTEAVASGRGPQFRDYGCEFVLRGPRGRMLASLAAGSSANVAMTVRGAHFLAQIDYTDMTWKLSRRKPDSDLPNYRYGADYELIEQSKMSIPAMDAVTEAWALGQVELPTLAQALPTHRLLDSVLRAAGAQPPYSFT